MLGMVEWKVTIYELPFMPHKVVICAVTRMLMYQCHAVAFTNAEMMVLVVLVSINVITYCSVCACIVLIFLKEPVT